MWLVGDIAVYQAVGLSFTVKGISNRAAGFIWIKSTSVILLAGKTYFGLG